MKKKVVIVGLGLLGGSMAMAIRKYTDCEVYGWNRTRSVAEKAAADGTLHGIADEAVIADADLMIISLYPQSTVDFLLEHMPRMKKGCIIVDLVGIKCFLQANLEQAAVDAGVPFIGGEICVATDEEGMNIVPEIMIPLVGEVKELKYVKDVIVKAAEDEIKKAGVNLKYKVGTMIEIPRAALTADEIAKEAEFFSFGTNDLTQMTFGFSRDDAGKFLNSYYDKKIYESDPFAKLDQKGVGKLVKMAVDLGKQTRPDIHLGICGEHGGNPPTVEFCHNIGLTYVSCSPFRVPIARLAAAQAAIKNPR